MYPTFARNNYLKLKPGKVILSAAGVGARVSTVINESAADILLLCNGFNSESDILNKLSQKYTGHVEFTKKFLSELIAAGILIDLEQPAKEKVQFIKGTDKFAYPDALIWELTSVCPLDCRHCYLGKKNGIHMSNEEIKKILSLIDKTGVGVVELTGGEPFANPLIDQIIKKLVDLDVQISIVTSGYLLDERVKKALSYLTKRDFVQISIDGDKEYHNYLRNNPRSYDNLIRFAEYCHSIGVNITVGHTYINQGFDVLEYVIALSKKLGAAMVKVSPLINMGNAKTGITSSCNKSELFNKVSELNRKYASDNFFIQESIKTNVSHCGAGNGLLRIMYDSSITPCPMIDDIFGNLKESSYDEIVERCYNIYGNITMPCMKGDNICDSCDHKNDCMQCFANAIATARTGIPCKWYASNKELLERKW